MSSSALLSVVLPALAATLGGMALGIVPVMVLRALDRIGGGWGHGRHSERVAGCVQAGLVNRSIRAVPLGPGTPVASRLRQREGQWM